MARSQLSGRSRKCDGAISTDGSAQYSGIRMP
jgi:hypothetical protein